MEQGRFINIDQQGQSDGEDGMATIIGARPMLGLLWHEGVREIRPGQRGRRSQTKNTSP